jgi:hypothetical protein
MAMCTQRPNSWMIWSKGAPLDAAALAVCSTVPKRGAVKSTARPSTCALSRAPFTALFSASER